MPVMLNNQVTKMAHRLNNWIKLIGKDFIMALIYLAGIIFSGIIVYVVTNMVSVSRNRMKLNI